MLDTTAAATPEAKRRAEPGRAMEIKAYRIFVCLSAVLSATLPSTGSAQTPESPHRSKKSAPALGSNTDYSCVDPSDVLARRWLQDEPCKLPMYHLPAPGVAGSSEPPRWPTYPPRSTEGAHTMFWRFPVQPMGPHEVPRHTWR